MLPALAPTVRRARLRDAARRVLRSSGAARGRAVVDGAFDAVRLRLDQSGLRAYQPAPIGAAASGRRADGSRSRWEAIARVLADTRPATALDVGCNAGWFTLNLARLGIRTIGVEADPPMYRTAILAARAAGPLRPGILVLRVDPDSVQQLPKADAVLLLSIWHHFVRDFGLEAADAILAAVWERTGQVLFFETGEDECEADFALPQLGPDPRAWVRDHLAAVCTGGEVRQLGAHDAFAPDGSACTRGLFVVERRSEGVAAG